LLQALHAHLRRTQLLVAHVIAELRLLLRGEYCHDLLAQRARSAGVLGTSRRVGLRKLIEEILDLIVLLGRKIETF